MYALWVTYSKIIRNAYLQSHIPSPLQIWTVKLPVQVVWELALKWDSSLYANPENQFKLRPLLCTVWSWAGNITWQFIKNADS